MSTLSFVMSRNTSLGLTTFNYKWIAHSFGALSFTYSLVQLINEKLVFCLNVDTYEK